MKTESPEEFDDPDDEFEALEAEIEANWTPEDQDREDRLRKKLQPFRDHQDKCEKGCRFFPISMACYEGAKLMNPALPDSSEIAYLHRTGETHKDCDWCNE
jgi:hypothetical protein